MPSSLRSLRALALTLALGLAGCETMTPMSSPGSVSHPMTLCDAPSLRQQCSDIDAATHWKTGVVEGNALVLSPLAEALFPTAGVESSADVANTVQVLESPTALPLAIVNPSEKWRVAVLRTALTKVKAPIPPREVAIVVKDPSQYADLQAQAAQLGLRLLLIPASQP